MPDRDNKKIVGIDLFAGAGGLSLGAKMAGVDVVFAVENNKFAAKTYALNHPSTTLAVKDIRTINKIPEGLFSSGSTIILFGGPPCQGYSTSNRRTNNRKNSQNWLYKEFLRFVNLVDPDWIVFENVTGICEFECGVFIREIISDFQNAGYACNDIILNAANYGVPQKRNRYFLVGSKVRTNINLKQIPGNQRMISVYDAISDLPSLDNGAQFDHLPYKCEPRSEYARIMRGFMMECSGHQVSRNADYVIKRYHYINQGENWSVIPAELMVNYKDTSRCHTGIYYRLVSDQPSVVIGNYRKNMLIHPWEDRGLSVREAARLQSFPDWYSFEGSIGFQQQQVGNAVPPLLAKHVFSVIINAARGDHNEIL